MRTAEPRSIIDMCTNRYEHTASVTEFAHDDTLAIDDKKMSVNTTADTTGGDWREASWSEGASGTFWTMWDGRTLGGLL